MSGHSFRIVLKDAKGVPISGGKVAEGSWAPSYPAYFQYTYAEYGGEKDVVFQSTYLLIDIQPQVSMDDAVLLIKLSDCISVLSNTRSDSWEYTFNSATNTIMLSGVSIDNEECIEFQIMPVVPALCARDGVTINIKSYEDSTLDPSKLVHSQDVIVEPVVQGIFPYNHE